MIGGERSMMKRHQGENLPDVAMTVQYRYCPVDSFHSRTTRACGLSSIQFLSLGQEPNARIEQIRLPHGHGPPRETGERRSNEQRLVCIL